MFNFIDNLIKFHSKICHQIIFMSNRQITSESIYRQQKMTKNKEWKPFILNRKARAETYFIDVSPRDIKQVSHVIRIR